MFIYLITNQITGKCYVGQTRRSLAQRFCSHKRVVGKANACKALSDAMLVHGTDNFTIELLRTCESQEEMNHWEIHFIAKFGTFAPGGYNLTLGGGGKSGYKHSAESIAKRNVHFIGKTLSDEHKRKVSDSLIGNQRALGLKHTDATKQKISAAFKGKKRSPFSTEHREKIGAARRGTKASEEARRTMSEGQKRRYEILRERKLNEAEAIGLLQVFA